MIRRPTHVAGLVWAAVVLVLLPLVLVVGYAWLQLERMGGPQSRALALDLAISGIGIAGVLGMLGYWAPAVALRPLHNMRQKVDSIAAGSLDERVTPEGLVEVRQLAQSINRMVGAVELRERRLIHRERTGAVDTLLAGVAHEIANPLTFVQFNEHVVLQFLRERAAAASGDEADRLGRLVHSVERNLTGYQRLARLVLILREISPQQRGGEAAEVDPNLIVEGTVVLLEHRVIKGLRVELELQSQRRVPVRGFELSHVLMTLFVNAAEAMHGKGTLRVRSRDDPEQVVIEVEDTGPGLPDVVRHTLFEPHVTTKKGAAGLGLSIARSLVQSMNGSIHAESPEAGGARFVIRLPSASPP